MTMMKRLRHAGEVGRPEMIAYGLMIWPLVMGQGGLTFLAAYYTQQFGLSLAAVGFVLTMGRIYDAALDPIVAYWSDCTPVRFGRRKLWVTPALILFCCAVWYLFAPSGPRSLWAYGFGVFAFFTTWTAAFTPYLAQGGEISGDHRRRTAINLTQSLALIVASILMSVLPYVLTDPQTRAIRLLLADGLAWMPHLGALDAFLRFLRLPAIPVSANYGNVMLVFVWMTTLIAPVVLAGYLFLVRPGSEKEASKEASLTAVFGNKSFRLFCVGYLLLMLGYMGRYGLFPFIVSSSAFGGVSYLLLLMVQNLCAMAATPLWAPFYRRFERGTCIAVAALLEASGLLVLAFGPAAAGTAIFAFVLMGLPGQTLVMAPYMVASDAADYSEWKDGTQSRGVHVSIVSLIIKLGAVGSAATVMIAGLLGFQSAQGINAGNVTMINWIGLVGPALLILIGAGLVTRFPITRARQRSLRLRLDRRAGRPA